MRHNCSFVGKKEEKRKTGRAEKWWKIKNSIFIGAYSLLSTPSPRWNRIFAATYYPAAIIVCSYRQAVIWDFCALICTVPPYLITSANFSASGDQSALLRFSSYTTATPFQYPFKYVYPYSTGCEKWASSLKGRPPPSKSIWEEDLIALPLE